jgi:hypothetical protein
MKLSLYDHSNDTAASADKDSPIDLKAARINCHVQVIQTHDYPRLERMNGCIQSLPHPVRRVRQLFMEAII